MITKFPFVKGLTLTPPPPNPLHTHARTHTHTHTHTHTQTQSTRCGKSFLPRLMLPKQIANEYTVFNCTWVSAST